MTEVSAEHTGENLLPCNAAVRLQARINNMSPLAQFDQDMENVIRELSLRIVIPALGEFEDVWEAANKVCDRYEIPGRVAA